MSSISGHPVAMTVGGAVVTKAYFNGQLVFEKSTLDTTGCYLYFKSSATFTVSMTKNWDGTMQYSTNGTGWKDWDGTAVTAVKDTSDKKYKVYFRGKENTTINSSFVYTGNLSCSVEGKIMSLLDYETVAMDEEPEMGENCFCGLFYSLEDKLTSCGFDLPATVIPANGYAGMFGSCTSLEVAPTIYAEVVGQGGLRGMFSDCAGLTTVQDKFYFTEVGANGCYYMFSRCTSLENLPTFANTIKAGEESFLGMFKNCSSMTNTKTFPLNLKALGKMCCYDMFAYCTSLVYAADINCSVALVQNAFNSMYEHCTALTDAGSISWNNKSAGYQSFYAMYMYCTSLEHLPGLTKYEMNGDNMCNNMFLGCTALKEVWSFASLGKTVSSISISSGLSTACFSYMYCDSGVKFSTSKTSECLYKYQAVTASVSNGDSVMVGLDSSFKTIATATVYTNATVITLNG